MVLRIHRARGCELSTLWGVDASAADSLGTLQQDHLKWEAVDDCRSSSSCYRKDAVTVSDGSIQLKVGASQCAKLRLSTTITGGHSLHRLSLRMQLPTADNRGQANPTAKLYLPNHNEMTLASNQYTNTNEVVVGSSLNESVAVELPCVNDIADSFHNVDFVWDDKWLRWYVDDILLREETVLKDDGENKDQNQLMLELSVSSSDDVTMKVEKVELRGGDAADPLCRPHYSSSSNCRPKTPFTPRLGSVRGSLSTEEVDAFIDEVASKFPLITKVEDLGRSIERRPLRALCLGACHVDTDMKIPQALFTGMHHAREPISMMNLVYTIDILTTDYLNGDLAALELLSSRQLWFMLVVNPDGYAHNEMQRVWEHNKMGQRKSALPNCNKSPIDAGVDLNRNYDVCFARDTKGSSNNPCGDDYAGSSAFSEPETKAVRDLVERNTSDFSVALNYHSYGKYFNLPYACQSEGEPNEPSNSTFRALASEMTHFNGFKYGQSWKESNLYTVNGETSDWMWQAHGIFAMSPEVGPAFDQPAVPGFWPLDKDVPQLSADLHYSNLYITRMAGPVYSLDVKSVQVESVEDSASSYVSVQVAVANNGLRSVSAELLGSMYLNGTQSSDPIRLKLAAEPRNTESGKSERDTPMYTLRIPSANELSQQSSKTLYLVIRDNFSCQLVRVAVNFEMEKERSPQAIFQQWTPHSLPRCGTCAFFGASKAAVTASSENSMCSHVKDVTLLQAVRTRSVHTGPKDTSNTPSSSKALIATTDSTISSIGDGNGTSLPTVHNATVNVSLSDGESIAEAGNHRASIVYSILPSPESWTGPIAMASIAGFALLVIVGLVFCRRRRCKKNSGRVKTAAGAQKQRSNVQYSRIDEDADSSHEDRISFDVDDDDEIDLTEVEFGRRRLSIDDTEAIASRGRVLSPPRRAPKQRSDSEDII